MLNGPYQHGLTPLIGLLRNTQAASAFNELIRDPCLVDYRCQQQRACEEIDQLCIIDEHGSVEVVRIPRRHQITAADV
jgi:hypothetical protein